jgi:hypothetical protein
MDIRSQILAADDLPREAVAVPEWGGVTVWVRTLTGTERDRFETQVAKDRQKPGGAGGNFRSGLLVLALCDEQGARLFADGDAGALGKKSSKALDRLLEVAMRLSGIGAKQQEEAEKNSETTTGAASSSG